MSIILSDVIRVETGETGLYYALRNQQSGFASDTDKMIHKFSDGTIKKYLPEDQMAIYGMTGIQGMPGETGLSIPGGTGVTGIQGVTGLIGTTGLQGGQGQTGSQGQTGASIIGPDGITGLQGSQGIQGQTGVQGDTGAQGIQGTQGDTGVTGIQGSQGNTGAIGTQGIQGDPGIQGNQGLQGVTGIQGLQGQTGAQGIQGATGLTPPAQIGGTGIAGSIPIFVDASHQEPSRLTNTFAGWFELNGSLNATGMISGGINLCRGNIIAPSDHSGDALGLTGGTWYQIVDNLFEQFTYNFTVASHKLFATYAGFYQVNYSLSISSNAIPGGSDIVETRVRRYDPDTSEYLLLQSYQVNNVDNGYQQIMGSGFMELKAGSSIELQIKPHTTGTTYILNQSLTAVRIGVTLI